MKNKLTYAHTDSCESEAESQQLVFGDSFLRLQGFPSHTRLNDTQLNPSIHQPRPYLIPSPTAKTHPVLPSQHTRTTIESYSTG